MESQKDIETRIEEAALGADTVNRRRESPVHGFIFQLKLLMLFLHRGVSKRYSFLLGTEIEEAKKFDDLVFRYEADGRTVFRLLQAKHRLDGAKAITEQSLLKETDKDFSLAKYFFSYIDAKGEELFKIGTIIDTTICTNINFSDDILRGASNVRLEKIKYEDGILDIKIGMKVKPDRYRFKAGSYLINKLKPKLDKYIAKTNRKQRSYKDDDINDFLKHLVFAVNCPNEEELGEVIKADIGKGFDLATAKNVYNEFYVMMLEWLQGKTRGSFFSYEEGREFFEKALGGISIRFEVKFPIESFSGRSKELRTIHEMMRMMDEKGPRPVCIAALGGIGKSELARAYVRKHGKSYDDNIIWISAESFETASKSFIKLSNDFLRLGTRNADGERKSISCIVSDVYGYFSRRKSLFVFDNANHYRSENEFDEGLDKFLPSEAVGCVSAYVLITSRNRKWPKNVKVFVLDVLDEEESVELIEKVLSGRVDNADLLARELQNFPLALQQAANYIRVQDDKLSCIGSGFSVDKYINKFREGAKLLLNFEFPQDCDNPYSKTIFVTWNVSLEVIRARENGGEAIEMLNILSYMTPDVPTDVFLDMSDDNESLATALDLLKQYSMINITGMVISIHRLVQRITRLKVQEQELEFETVKKALQIVSKKKLSGKSVNNAMTVCMFSTAHVDLLKEFCWFLPCISAFLVEMGRFEEVLSKSFGTKTRESLISLQSETKLLLQSFIAFKNDEGVALYGMKEYQMGLRVFRQLLDTCEADLEPNHHLTLIVKSNIATVYHAMEKYREAVDIYQDILQSKRTVLGENHPQTLFTKGSIAKILFMEGNLEEAFHEFKELHQIQKNVLGPDHSETLDTKLSLAITIQRQSRYDEAMQMLQEICSIQQALLEFYHPKLLHTKNCIAVLLIFQGMSDEALSIFQEILEIQKITFGNGSPKALRTMFYIANLLQDQNKHEDALKILEEIYEIQKDILGERHPESLDSLYDIGNALFYLGKYTESLHIYQRVHQSRTSVLGVEHQHTLRVRNSTACTFLEMGKYDMAIRELEDVLRCRKEVLGDNHLDTLETKHDLGRALVCKENFDDALDIFQEILKEFTLEENTRPLDHTNRLRTMLSLADLFFKKNRLGDALEICEELLKIQICLEDKDTAEMKFLMGQILQGKGRNEVSLKLLKEAQDTFSKVLGARHSKTLKLMMG